MTTLADLVADVAIVTARPDLVATGDIGLAVRRATVMLHAAAMWPMDLAESVVTFADTTARNQSIGTVVSLERFRAIKYIREYFPAGNDSINAGEEAFYERRESSHVLNEYGQTDDNIWYLGGTNINLRGRTAIEAVSIGWFRYPVTTVTGYSSWIADVYPFAIIDEAARLIFLATGFTDMSNRYNIVCAEHRQNLIINYIDGEGR